MARAFEFIATSDTEGAPSTSSGTGMRQQQVPPLGS